MSWESASLAGARGHPEHTFQQPLTEQADAQPGQALPEPLAQTLRELSPPLLLPVVVLLIQRQSVHVPGQARGQVGDGGEGTCGHKSMWIGLLVTYVENPGRAVPRAPGSTSVPLGVPRW